MNRKISSVVAKALLLAALLPSFHWRASPNLRTGTAAERQAAWLGFFIELNRK
jgi:hypothetical protein